MELEHIPSLENQRAVDIKGLEKLPSEVLVMIMRSADDLQALYALISTSLYLYSTFKATIISILWSVLHRVIGELMPYARGAVLASRRATTTLSNREMRLASF
jgi:hypothetical protein